MNWKFWDVFLGKKPTPLYRHGVGKMTFIDSFNFQLANAALQTSGGDSLVMVDKIAKSLKIAVLPLSLSLVDDGSVNWVDMFPSFTYDISMQILDTNTFWNDDYQLFAGPTNLTFGDVM